MALTKVTGSVIKDSVSLSGNVSVGGTLTYQDVTNVDALGIGTFRTGIKVLAGQVDVGSNIKLGNAGVITATSFSGVMSGTTGSFSGQVNVGSNIKLGTAGVVTATTFVGNFTGTSSGNAVLTGSTNNQLVTVTGANAITGEANLTFDGSSLLQFTHTAGSGGQAIIKTKATQANSSSFIRAEDSGSTYIGLLKYGTGHSAYGALGAGDGALYANSGGGNSTNICIMADSSTGYINFATGGNAERLRIESTGTVTFKGGDTGTDAIAVQSEGGGANIHISNFRGVNDTGDTGRLGVGKNNNALIFINASGSQVDNFAIGNTDSKPLVLSTANTQRIHIAGAGNVGIASTIPSKTLDVRGDALSNKFVARSYPTSSYTTSTAGYKFGARGSYALSVGGNKSGNSSSFTMFDLKDFNNSKYFDIEISFHHAGGGVHGSYRRFAGMCNGYTSITTLHDTGNVNVGGGSGFAFSKPDNNTLRVVWNGASSYADNYTLYCLIHVSYEHTYFSYYDSAFF